jgi:hypothetical protein
VRSQNCCLPRLTAKISDVAFNSGATGIPTGTATETAIRSAETEFEQLYD